MSEERSQYEAQITAKVVISGVLVLKDAEGNVVAERPFSTPVEVKEDAEHRQ